MMFQMPDRQVSSVAGAGRIRMPVRCAGGWHSGPVRATVAPGTELNCRRRNLGWRSACA